MSDAKQWFSAAELAAMKLPGLPSSERRMKDKASRENWHSQKRSCRGGGMEYQPPKAILQLIFKRQVAAQSEVMETTLPAKIKASLPTPVASKPIKLEEATTQQRDVMRAREVLMRFIEGFHGPVHEAIDWLNAEYRAGTNSMVSYSMNHAWDKPRADLTLTKSTYYKWVKAKDERGVAIPLKPQKDFTVKPWHAMVITLAQRPQGSTRRWIAEKVAEQYPDVSYHMIGRFLTEKFSQIDQLKGRHTGSALAAHKFHHTRDYSSQWPFTEVHADGWNTHFTAPHPFTGEFVTLEVWHAHDTATRFVPPVAVGLTENFEVIAKCAENCIRVGGVMAILQTDSTGSVKNDRFEYDPVTSIADRAGITIAHPLVGNSQANGIAENFNKYLDQASKELATYQARGMDSLTLKRVKKITEKMVKAKTVEDRLALKNEAERMGKGIVFDSFHQAVDWLNQKVDEFNRRPHRSLPKIRDEATGKMRHQSPIEALAEAKRQGWQPVAVSEAELVDIFRPHERKIVRRGGVRVYGQRYATAHLEHYNGQQVQVAYDMADGSKVYVKDLSGRLLMEVPFYESRDGRCRSFIEMALNKRADAQIRRLENKAEAIEARRPGALIEQQDQYEIPVMTIDLPVEEAAEVAPDVEEVAEVKALNKPFKRPIFTTDAEKYRWLMQAAPELVSETDDAWLDWYKLTSEWEDLFGDGEAAAK